MIAKTKNNNNKKKQVIAKNRRPAPSPESASAHCTSFIKNANPHTCYLFVYTSRIRSSLPQVFSGKDVLKICSKFTGEQPCQSVISKQLNWNGCLCSSTLSPRPLSSALDPQNIARTNLWIKHITYSRLYLFKIKTLYLFKIFQKLFRKDKLWCPK